jgi:preprotein translocase SecE subunit
MAITRNQASLVDTQLNSSSQMVDKSKKDSELDGKRVKKSSFISSTVDEMKKVSWPSFRYVVNWSCVIICFSALFAVSLGFFDHIFTGGIKFVDCTSTGYKNEQTDKQKKLNECSQQFGDYIVFKAK